MGELWGSGKGVWSVNHMGNWNPVEHVEWVDQVCKRIYLLHQSFEWISFYCTVFVCVCVCVCVCISIFNFLIFAKSGTFLWKIANYQKLATKRISGLQWEILGNIQMATWFLWPSEKRNVCFWEMGFLQKKSFVKECGNSGHISTKYSNHDTNGCN